MIKAATHLDGTNVGDGLTIEIDWELTILDRVRSIEHVKVDGDVEVRIGFERTQPRLNGYDAEVIRGVFEVGGSKQVEILSDCPF